MLNPSNNPSPLTFDNLSANKPVKTVKRGGIIKSKAKKTTLRTSVKAKRKR